MSHLEIEEIDLTPPANRDDRDDWLIRNFSILKEMLIRGYFKDGLILGKEAGTGILLNTDTPPTYAWKDLIGIEDSDAGGSAPTLKAYVDEVDQLAFNAGDALRYKFHIPHDYVPGTDLFVHVHFSHLRTDVTGGTADFEFKCIYSKGHGQEQFGASQINVPIVAPVSLLPRFHSLTEVQLSAAGGAGGLLDTDAIEVDGLILAHFEYATNNITGTIGPQPDVFVHTVDIHYQSSNIGTKDKIPNFYT